MGSQNLQHFDGTRPCYYHGKIFRKKQTTHKTMSGLLRIWTTEAETACHPNSGVQSACCINTYLSSIHKSVQQSYMSVIPPFHNKSHSIYTSLCNIHSTYLYSFPNTTHLHIFTGFQAQLSALQILNKVYNARMFILQCAPTYDSPHLTSNTCGTNELVFLTLVSQSDQGYNVAHLALTLFGEMISWTDQLFPVVQFHLC